MAEVSPSQTEPDLQTTPRRRLKRPRVTNACSFCRKRKTRCSGGQPCELCVREGITCDFGPNGPPRGLTSSNHPYADASNVQEQSSITAQTQSAGQVQSIPNAGTNISHEGLNDGHSSTDILPATSAQGNHVDPSSGVSFLYQHWVPGQESDLQSEFQNSEKDDAQVAGQVPLVSYGDIALLDRRKVADLPTPSLHKDHLLEILDRYFEYVSPSLRFLHHPSVREWALAYARQDRNLTASRSAAVLFVCAQTLLQPFDLGDGETLSRITCEKLGVACSVRAKSLLEQERGPPSLASVQARIAMCLYLLSTFRLNECRYCFSFTVTIATAMGLHRKNSTSRTNCLEGECRKRTFWTLFIIDGYLSVMLGRPRLLRTSDVDQPFPANVNDRDLMSCEKLDHLPKHGNLEALIAQAELVKLLAESDEQLYPLYQLGDNELLRRSNSMLDKLQEWLDKLPSFLKPRSNTLTGQRTFERQNTILKLAAAHTRILITRRCILVKFRRSNNEPCYQEPQPSLARRCIQECVSGITTALDTIDALINDDRFPSSFWSTQYIALVAVSSLYVLILQGVRGTLPDDIKSFIDVKAALERSHRCQDFLITLAPAGSQARRHHLLLAKLRSQVEHYTTKRAQIPRDPQQSTAETMHENGNSISPTGAPPNSSNNRRHQGYPPLVHSGSGTLAVPASEQSGWAAVEQGFPTENSNSLSMLTPTSGSDVGFEYISEYGWDQLDAVGLSTMDFDFGRANILVDEFL